MMAILFNKIHVRAWELGLVFRDGELEQVLEPGWHKVFRWGRREVQVVSKLDVWFRHDLLPVLVKDELLPVLVKDEALARHLEVLDLAEHERALVWIDGRYQELVGPGLHALFKSARELKVERVDTRTLRFEHAQLGVVLGHSSANLAHGLTAVVVPDGCLGLVYVDGAIGLELGPGVYAFWRDVKRLDTALVELRETMTDVSGQELMTADRVTLRLNAVVVSRVVDPKLALRATKDHGQALYRDAQLTLRAVVGGRDLDALLSDKDAVSRELLDALRARAAAYGVEVLRLGIRDVILPGDMKELLNKVTEAKKAAEASVITRREETAAMRSQANTAKLLAANPTLMRLRELEALEKVAEHGKLQVVLGEKGLAERITNLI